jgi:hypothetical protein
LFEASSGRRCHDLFSKILGSKIDENQLGFAREEKISLYVVVWRLEAIEVGRSEE